jgi:hypothetical protein
MIQHPNAGIEEFKKKAVEYLNILLGQSEQSYMYWEFDLIRVRSVFGIQLQNFFGGHFLTF